MAGDSSNRPDDVPDDDMPQEDRGRAAFADLGNRITGLFKPPPPKEGDDAVVATPDRPMNDDEKRQWMRSLEPLERRWANILAGIGAALSIYSIFRIVENTRVWTKQTLNGHTSYHWVRTGGSYELDFAVQVILIIGMVLAARSRKRSLLAFCALVLGLAIGAAFGSFILGVPYIFYFGWLMIRAWRVQRYGSPTARGAAAGAAAKRDAKRGRTGTTAGTDTGAATGTGSTPTGRTTARSASKRKATAPTTDAAKRYTPKSTKTKTDRYAPKD